MESQYFQEPVPSTEDQAVMTEGQDVFVAQGDDDLGGTDAAAEDELVPSREEQMERTGEKYFRLLEDKWRRMGKRFPGVGLAPATGESVVTVGQGQVYNPLTSGVFGRKVFCSHWLRTGECDFTQQGCNYLHLMPDVETMNHIGMRSYPRWFREMTRDWQVDNSVDFDERALQEPGLRSRMPPIPHRAGQKARRSSAAAGAAAGASGVAVGGSTRGFHPYPQEHRVKSKKGGRSGRGTEGRNSSFRGTSGDDDRFEQRPKLQQSIAARQQPSTPATSALRKVIARPSVVRKQLKPPVPSARLPAPPSGPAVDQVLPGMVPPRPESSMSQVRAPHPSRPHLHQNLLQGRLGQHGLDGQQIAPQPLWDEYDAQSGMSHGTFVPSHVQQFHQQPPMRYNAETGTITAAESIIDSYYHSQHGAQSMDQDSYYAGQMNAGQMNHQQEDYPMGSAPWENASQYGDSQSWYVQEEQRYSTRQHEPYHQGREHCHELQPQQASRKLKDISEGYEDDMGTTAGDAETSSPLVDSGTSRNTYFATPVGDKPYSQIGSGSSQVSQLPLPSLLSGHTAHPLPPRPEITQPVLRKQRQERSSKQIQKQQQQSDNSENLERPSKKASDAIDLTHNNQLALTERQKRLGSKHASASTQSNRQHRQAPYSRDSGKISSQRSNRKSRNRNRSQQAHTAGRNSGEGSGDNTKARAVRSANKNEGSSSGNKKGAASPSINTNHNKKSKEHKVTKPLPPPPSSSSSVPFKAGASNPAATFNKRPALNADSSADLILTQARVPSIFDNNFDMAPKKEENKNPYGLVERVPGKLLNAAGTEAVFLPGCNHLRVVDSLPQRPPSPPKPGTLNYLAQERDRKKKEKAEAERAAAAAAAGNNTADNSKPAGTDTPFAQTTKTTTPAGSVHGSVYGRGLAHEGNKPPPPLPSSGMPTPPVHSQPSLFNSEYDYRFNLPNTNDPASLKAGGAGASSAKANVTATSATTTAKAHVPAKASAPTKTTAPAAPTKKASTEDLIDLDAVDYGDEQDMELDLD